MREVRHQLAHLCMVMHNYTRSKDSPPVSVSDFLFGTPDTDAHRREAAAAARRQNMIGSLRALAATSGTRKRAKPYRRGHP